jgi:hypothetical protein
MDESRWTATSSDHRHCGVVKRAKLANASGKVDARDIHVIGTSLSL